MKLKHLRHLLLIGLASSSIFWPLTSFAQPPVTITAAPTHTLSLTEAIFLALRYNPNVRNAEIQRVVDKFNLHLANYAYELQYAFTASANYANTVSSGSPSEQSNYSVSPQINYNSPIGTKLSVAESNPFSATSVTGTYFNPAVTVTVTQPLLQGFGTAVNLAPLYNAYDQETINKFNLKNTIIQTITQVINQYAAVVQAENTLKTEQLALTTSIATVKQYQAQIKAGTSAPADLVQFQNDVANQQLALAAQQVNILQVKMALLNLLGLAPDTNLQVSNIVAMKTPPLPSLARCIQLSLNNNIQYLQQQINLKILQRQLVIAKDQQRWQLNATASQTFGGGSGGGDSSGPQSLFNGQNRSTNIGLQLTIPIDNLTQQSQLVQAKTALEQAQISFDALKRQIISDTTNAYNTLLNQKQQITEAQTALNLAQQNLNNAYIKLTYGRNSPFEVSSLQTALTNAQLAVINSQINYVNSYAAFEQILGTTLDAWGIQIRY